MSRLDGQGLRHHRRRGRHRRGDGRRCSAPRARRSSASTCATTRRATSSLACDVTDEDAGRATVRARARGVRDDRRAVQQRRHLPQRRRLGPRHRRSRRGSACRTSTCKSVFLCCKHGIPHLLETRRRLGDQHRLVRRGDGRGDLADLLHGVQGRRAGAVARARRRVRAPRRARQRALPRPGRHAAAAASSTPTTRSRPRAGSCTCRWGASPRRDEIANAALFLASRRVVATSPRRRSWSTAGSPAPT